MCALSIIFKFLWRLQVSKGGVTTGSVTGIHTLDGSTAEDTKQSFKRKNVPTNYWEGSHCTRGGGLYLVTLGCTGADYWGCADPVKSQTCLFSCLSHHHAPSRQCLSNQRLSDWQQQNCRITFIKLNSSVQHLFTEPTFWGNHSHSCSYSSIHFTEVCLKSKYKM